MKNLLSDLNPEQVAAVEVTDGPVLILAGAGSGKTRVLTYKVAYLISKGVKPENILAVTFTNKAANEMKERIYKLLVHGSRSTVNNLPFVGTFHAFCAKLLRIDGKFIGLPRGYLIYDDSDSLSLIKRVMADLDISTKNFRPASIAGAISSAKSELLDEVNYRQFAQTHFTETVAKVYDQYQKQLRETGACDFDDLLMNTVRLFEGYPNVLSHWAGKFKYVLVDEYQDVNTAQYVLTKQLASTYGNLTVVGDASQAIYSFRGADFRNILNFERDFPNARVFNLEQNYRSTQTILTASNRVIEHNSTHPILKLWTKNPEGEKINIYEAQNEIDEANFVVNVILGSEATPESDSGQARMTTGRPKLSSFAVLYRTNAQSRTIEEALLHESIPYRLWGGVSFYARKEVKDVLSYLRLVLNPKDKVSRNRVEKLGKRRLEKFDEMVSSLRHPERSEGSKDRKKDSSSLDKLGTQNDKVFPAPEELINKVLETTDYLLLIDDGTEQGLMRVENVKELKSVARDFENLETFLENVALMEGKIAPEKSYESGGRDQVTLMTTHSAKGLEFDNVIIVGMEEGLFPHARSMLEAGQMEEERRLAYVGMTRAKKKLYLTYAARRLYIGTLSSNLVSRFVTDIPEELVTST